MKRNKSEKYYISDKQLDKIKLAIGKEVTQKAVLLTIAATADELKLTEEKYCRIANRVNRYADNLDAHLVRLEEVRKSILDSTGIDLGGF